MFVGTVELWKVGFKYAYLKTRLKREVPDEDMRKTRALSLQPLDAVHPEDDHLSIHPCPSSVRFCSSNISEHLSLLLLCPVT